MSDKLSPDSERARKSRDKRLKKGGVRIDSIVAKETAKTMERIMTVREIDNRTELLTTLIQEEGVRVERRIKREKKRDAQEQD